MWMPESVPAHPVPVPERVPTAEVWVDSSIWNICSWYCRRPPLRTTEAADADIGMEMIVRLRFRRRSRFLQERQLVRRGRR